MKKIEVETPKDTVNVKYAHVNENTARMMSMSQAREELNKKAGKPVQSKILSNKLYKLPDGRYESHVSLTQEDDN